MLAQIREGHNVPNVLGVRLCVDDVNLNPVDHGPRVGHRQGLHRVVVLVDEVLRQEVVSVGFVVVGADVEFLRLGPALHFNLTPLPLLLAEHCGVVEAAPLGLELQTKQTLRPRNQAAVERHVDVAGLDVLENVVLFALEANVHLVLKVEERLGVVLRAEFNLVANLAANVQLDALIEIHRTCAALTFRNAGVLGVVPGVAQGDFSRSLRLDLDLVAPKNHLEELAVDFELGGERAVRFVFLFLEFVPEFGEVAFDVVVQVFVQGEQA